MTWPAQPPLILSSRAARVSTAGAPGPSAPVPDGRQDAAAACRPASRGEAAALRTEIGKASLLGKIKGGWAGQVIGCTFGGPTEFRFPGAMIHDYQPVAWDETLIARRFERSPGLYDDVYMDLTFVEVMAREGIDAPAASHAQAFARAPYPLWHANQAARSNILAGLLPPDSGHWTNSPHADDIDFQIEADFAGLMSPGLVNAAAAICDRVGHIMNYGDGWYGGVYVAAMYSLAFVSPDVPSIVENALRVLPPQSGFARCVRDVVAAYRADPSDSLEPHDDLRAQLDAGHGADQHDETQPVVYVAKLRVAHGRNHRLAGNVCDVGADGEGHRKA
jgi:hypothetical protein